MPYRWAEETVFRRIDLNVEDRNRECPECGTRRHVCAKRRRRFFSLKGPVLLQVDLLMCPHELCSTHGSTHGAPDEAFLAPPRWAIDWEVFAWIGLRRFGRHWSVPQLHAELADTFQITLSVDAIEQYCQRYQTMVAARESDLERIKQAYRPGSVVQLTIDGLQPEKGHETLYVVRELTQQRVWFAEPLLCSSAAEVRRLFVRARELAQTLQVRVELWMSDKQDAFLTGIAAEFPDVPHRYCQNHFLRDVAAPVLEQDSQAKVKMRGKVRGLRAIERAVLERQHRDAVPQPAQEPAPHPVSQEIPTNGLSTEHQDRVDAVVLDAVVLDAVVLDAVVLDAVVLDTAVLDTAAVDAGAVDAGVLEAVALEAGALETAALEAGVLEAGVLEAGVLEAVVLDTAAVDAAAVDADVLETVAVEAGALETAALDAVVLDAVVLETVVLETVVLETAAVDAAAVDAGVLETGALETVVLDAVVLDAVVLDAGALDTAAVDAVVLETVLLDAGVLDTVAVETVVLDGASHPHAGNASPTSPNSATTTRAVGTSVAAHAKDSDDAVVLDYCAAVRGILNDDQGGPLHLPGLRMASALRDVRESLQRSLKAKKGGLQNAN